jgi:PAS domain S-box-containing protein
MLEMAVFHEVVYGPDGHATDYRILDCNPAFTRATGIERDMAVGRLASEVYGSAPYLETYARVAATGQPERFDAFFSPMSRHFSISAISTRRGSFVTIATDVTERERSAAMLQRYRLLAESAKDIILFISRSDGRVIEANTAAIEAYGYEREELLALTVYDLRERETVGATASQMAAADEAGLRFETVHRRKDGMIFPVEVSSAGTTLDGTRVLVSVIRDISERKRAAEELLRSQAELHAILESLVEGVVVSDLQGRLLYWNPAALAIHGYSGVEEPGLWLSELVNTFELSSEEGVVPVDRWPLARILAGDTLRDLQLVVRRLGTEWKRSFSYGGRLVQDPGGRGLMAVVTMRDVTEREEARGRLVAERERLAVTLRSIGDAVIATDQAGRVMLMNEVAELLTGWRAEDAAGQPIQLVFNIVHEQTRQPAIDPVARVLREGGIVGLANHTSLISRDGTERPIADSGAPIRGARGQVVGVVLVFRDRTEERQAEAERERLSAQLAGAQKLESVGRLAGGIAHDFNNLLTIILSCAEALKGTVSDGAMPSLDDVEDIATAGARARDLTGRLLAFARKQVTAPVPLDLNGLVRGAEKLLRRVVGEAIRVEMELEPALWSVRCDPNQLEQVFMNLVLNARDAMPRGGGVSVATRNVQLAASLDTPGGDFVQLTIRDTGTGMAPAVKNHLFEPFFTTKPLGQGTGLGLATVYGIVAQSGGHVRVQSELGLGTTVQVLLPRTTEEVSAVAPASLAVSATGSETVFLVEDEERVREVAVRALRAAGYRVFTASGGREGLELVSSDEVGPVHLLVTDVVMPEADGVSVAKAFRQKHPEARVLFVSGYARGAIADHGLSDGGMELLPKPFTPSTLLARVRAILDGKNA